MDQIVAERFTRMNASENACADAITKCLRLYPTVCHPLLLERLSFYNRTMDTNKYIEGRTFRYTETAIGFRGNNLMNYCFQSFYVQEQEGQEEYVIPIKVSMKTQVRQASGSMSVREAVVATLDKLLIDGSRVVDLYAYASLFVDSIHLELLVNDYANSPLNLAIQGFLSENHYTFPLDKFLSVPGRQETTDTDLTLKVKYYASRDDHRAYCVDTSLIRSLVGACLQRLLCPSSLNTRCRLHTASLLQPRSKDIANILLSKPKTGDQLSILVICDVSNFTGSFGNAWLMLHCMCLDASNAPELKAKRNLFSIDGRLISARWVEIMALYLYLTVGIPCYVKDRHSYHSLSGGFLGVTGNISLGLLMLTVTLQQLLYELQGYTLDLKCQIGGDDFLIALTCNILDKEICLDMIRRTVTQFVGHLKEMNVFDLTQQPDGVVPGSVFCKKRIIVTSDADTIRIIGEPSVPVPEVLTDSYTIKSRFAIRKAWQTMDRTLLNYEVKYGGTDICDTFRVMFLKKYYPHAKPERSKTNNYWRNYELIYTESNMFFTNNALRKVHNVRPLHTEHHNCFITIPSKVAHALQCRQIVLRKVKIGMEELNIHIVPRLDSWLFKSETMTEWLTPIESKSFVAKLNKF